MIKCTKEQALLNLDKSMKHWMENNDAPIDFDDLLVAVEVLTRTGRGELARELYWDVACRIWNNDQS